MSTSGLPPQLTSTSPQGKVLSTKSNYIDHQASTPTTPACSYIDTNSPTQKQSLAAPLPFSPRASGSDALPVSLLKSETQRRVNLPSSSAAPTRTLHLHVIPKTASDISPTATHFPRGFRTRVPCKAATATAPTDRILMQTRCQVCLF